MSISQIVLASGNAKKLKELRSCLGEFHVEVLPQSDFKLSEAVEDGLSFIENAIIKARHACHHTGLPALADDSGLEVDALNGEPGIYSARYADGQGDAANNTKLLNRLSSIEVPERSARFRCVLAFMRHAADPTPLICTGTWEGHIATEQSGDNGFGYDPLFIPNGFDISAAQLTAEQKNQISHRGQAMQLLKSWWQQQFNL
ncbi:RdgB/HAM1 family non-canonical purine NTP pyrophosphatase [Gynuella sp.]|uniref:RdgB/HAM1 family non-canonical purine NTP pyrophosphatase n=1 Tax=Gynuella sp. TaxID=2969146 RepID=UPI003D11E958